MNTLFSPILLLLLYSATLSAQNDAFDDKFLGYWSGAFVKGNSFQRIDAEITKRADQYFALLIMEEWHPAFGEFEVSVQIDSIQNIAFPTGYGHSKLRLDLNNLEMIGYITDQTPQISLHLKKQARPPAPSFDLEVVQIANKDIQLAGHLHIPKLRTNTAIIIVGGRGCYAGNTKYDLYAKILRRYGVSVLAYQKRGTGQSSGDCNAATISDLASDLVAAKEFLANHPNGYDNIGVLGLSAGGWTMAKAEELTDFDFMMSVAGPATSVKDQQLQSAEYGAQFYGLSATATQHLLDYVELLFKNDVNTKDYQQLEQLLSNAQAEGWMAILEDTDKPVSLEKIDELWVRRHNYDPVMVWQNYDRPLIAIFGERDWIVPPQENTARLHRYFASHPEKLTTIVAHNGEHGMEMEAKYISLTPDVSYWHYYRISPSVSIEIINFLDRIGATRKATE